MEVFIIIDGLRETAKPNECYLQERILETSIAILYKTKQSQTKRTAQSCLKKNKEIADLSKNKWNEILQTGRKKNIVMHLCSEVTGKHTSTGFACRTQVTQGCLFGHQRFGNVQLPSGRQVMKSTSSESVSDTPSEHSGKTDKQNLRQLHRQTPLFTHLNTPLHVAKYEKSIETELSTMTDHKTVHGWKWSKGRNVASTIATPPWLS